MIIKITEIIQTNNKIVVGEEKSFIIMYIERRLNSVMWIICIIYDGIDFMLRRWNILIESENYEK